MSESKSIPFDANAIAGTLAHIAAAEGNTAAVAVLAVATPRIAISGHDNWDGGTDLLTLFLELPTPLYAQLLRRREQIQDDLLPMLKPIIEARPGYRASAVSIVPTDSAPDNWRDLAKAWLAGSGTSNQGRVRSDNIASRSCDGLLFRSLPKIHLYRALKALGVSFAPLPVFVRGGGANAPAKEDLLDRRCKRSATAVLGRCSCTIRPRRC
jgi:hypothetical protein